MATALRPLPAPGSTSATRRRLRHAHVSASRPEIWPRRWRWPRVVVRLPEHELGERR